MHLIATRDSCITRGSEALRNRMCDLNKYISLNICNDSSLLLSSNIAVAIIIILIIIIIIIIIITVTFTIKWKCWRNRILKSRVKNVMQTWFRFTHTSIFTRVICVSGIIQFEEHSLFQEDYFIWTLVYIYRIMKRDSVTT